MVENKLSLCIRSSYYFTMDLKESSDFEFQRPPGEKLSDPEILKKSCTFLTLLRLPEANFAFKSQLAILFFSKFLNALHFESQKSFDSKLLNSFNKRFE